MALPSHVCAVQMGKTPKGMSHSDNLTSSGLEDQHTFCRPFANHIWEYMCKIEHLLDTENMSGTATRCCTPQELDNFLSTSILTHLAKATHFLGVPHGSLAILLLQAISWSRQQSFLQPTFLRCMLQTPCPAPLNMTLKQQFWSLQPPVTHSVRCMQNNEDHSRGPQARMITKLAKFWHSLNNFQADIEYTTMLFGQTRQSSH